MSGKIESEKTELSVPKGVIVSSAGEGLNR